VRRPPGFAVVAALLLAVWAAALVLHGRELAAGRLAWVGVWVRAGGGAGAPPVVRGVWPGSAAEAAGLRPGDRLTRVAATPLDGVGPLGFVVRVYTAAGPALRVPLAVVRDGALLETTLALTPIAYAWRLLPLTVGFVLAGTLVLVRRGPDRLARAFFLGAVAFALHWTLFPGGPPAVTWAWIGIFAVASTVVFPLLLRPLLLFPAEVAPRDGRLRWWPWAFAVFGPIATSWAFGLPLPPVLALRAAFAVNVAFMATVLVVVTRSYRRAGAVGRRQLRWVVYGLWAGMLPMVVADAVTAAAPSLSWLHDVAAVPQLLVPLCILVAIVRFNLFDVDRVITVTAAYTLLSIAFVAAVLTVVPAVAQAASTAVGLPAAQGQLVLSLVTAALVVPAQRRLRPQIERLFFVERWALERGVARLLRELSACAGPDALLSATGERLAALLQADHCVIYGRVDEVFAPVFVRGLSAPPAALPAAMPLVRRLAVRGAPVAAESGRGGDAAAQALVALDAAVALPVRRAEALAALVCLGAKRSGDVYTPTDLALLAAVADKVSGELARFDEAEVLRGERAMSEALRRWVPAPVAARIASGRALDGGERVVSVLFVDIRGYTSLSEHQGADVMFATVSRYTEAISDVIRRRNGTVVEFLGDGVMAVFGAPEPLPEHAHAAVEAARAIIDAARASGVAVGVGVATGPAFVGSISTTDRLIYTAIGDTVNLASRLQALTRELGAAVALDPASWRSGGDVTADFLCRQGTTIRGRQQAVDVYYLPLL
jgi:class 3 adenylate cyclase